jgi:hypothetical protein
MARVIGADVEWHEGWANRPHLEIQVDGEDALIRYDEPLWRTAEADGRTYVVAEKEIEPPRHVRRGGSRVVSYVALDERRPPAGGALGGSFALSDGSTLTSPGGWSSRAGVVNLLLAELGLSDEVLDVTLVTPDHAHWSASVTLALACSAVAAYLPGVYLVREARFAGDEPYYTPSIDPQEVVKAGARPGGEA